MIGVANGLSYLHSNDVVHGDLKGVSHANYRGLFPLTLIHQPNILFDGAGTPQIADFGASSITFNPHTSNSSTAVAHGHSIRWAAPEILQPMEAESRRPTRASDVYAFAMVVVEVKYFHRSPSPKF